MSKDIVRKKDIIKALENIDEGDPILRSIKFILVGYLNKKKTKV